MTKISRKILANQSRTCCRTLHKVYYRAACITLSNNWSSAQCCTLLTKWFKKSGTNQFGNGDMNWGIVHIFIKFPQGIWVQIALLSYQSYLKFSAIRGKTVLCTPWSNSKLCPIFIWNEGTRQTLKLKIQYILYLPCNLYKLLCFVIQEKHDYWY